MEKMYHTNPKQKKAILMLTKLDLKTRNITRNEKITFQNDKRGNRPKR